MWNISLKILCALVVFLSFSGLAGAQTSGGLQNNADFVTFTDEISAAVNSGDEDLIASIVARAIDKNPGLYKQILAFAVAEYPSASPAIVKAVQSVSPNRVADVVSVVTSELAKKADNQSVIAQVLAETNPAAGQSNNVNVSDVAFNQQNNAVDIPVEVKENPSVISNN